MCPTIHCTRVTTYTIWGFQDSLSDELNSGLLRRHRGRCLGGRFSVTYWGSFVACLHDVDLSGGHRGADTRVVLEHLDERHVVRQHDILDVGLFLEVLRYSAVRARGNFDGSQA